MTRRSEVERGIRQDLTDLAAPGDRLQLSIGFELVDRLVVVVGQYERVHRARLLIELHVY